MDEDDGKRDEPGLIDLDMKQFGSGSMNDPLRHAVGLRSAQDKCKMRMWNSFPSLFQNTIFHGEQDASIKSLRHSGSLAERLERAKELKEAGNAALKTASSTATPAPAPSAPAPTDREKEVEEQIGRMQETITAKEKELAQLRRELRGLQAELEEMKSQRAVVTAPKKQVPDEGKRQQDGLEDAIRSYEKAAGLLRYVECIRPDWRNSDGSFKGIEDVYLRVDESSLEADGPEASGARELVTSCYLNIALASQRLGKFDQMLAACSEVLDKVNPGCVKALYRRAQARVAPLSALDADREAAIQDLHAAALLAPQDKDVRALLTKLREEKKAKDASERGTFAGLFNRGEVVTNDPRQEGEKPKDLDLNDPRVQHMLDIRPGPGGFTPI